MNVQQITEKLKANRWQLDCLTASEREFLSAAFIEECQDTAAKVIIDGILKERVAIAKNQPVQ